MRQLFCIAAAAAAGVALGASVAALVKKRQLDQQNSPESLSPAEAMLEAAEAVSAFSSVADKVLALRVFGYSFVFEPEDYSTHAIETAWLAHMKFLELPPDHPERKKLITDIEYIGRTAK